MQMKGAEPIFTLQWLVGAVFLRQSMLLRSADQQEQLDYLCGNDDSRRIVVHVDRRSEKFNRQMFLLLEEDDLQSHSKIVFSGYF